MNCHTQVLETIRQYPWMNRFEVFVEMHSDWGWCMQWLSCNPSITMKFIDKHPEMKWDWTTGVCINPNLTQKYVDAHPDKLWEHWYQYRTPMSMEKFNRLIDDGLSLTGLSRSSMMPIEFVELHPEIKWDVEHLSANPNLTTEFVEKHLDWEWNYSTIAACCKKLTTEFIERHLTFGWCRYFLSNHRCVTTEFIEQHMDWSWSYEYMSRNPNLTFDFVERHLGENWDIQSLSSHSNLTRAFVEKHSDWKWDMEALSRNPCVTPEFVRQHPDWAWSNRDMAANPNFTLKIIEQMPELRDGMALSWNPNLTLDFIDDNLGLTWDATKLSCATFAKCVSDWEERKAQPDKKLAVVRAFLRSNAGHPYRFSIFDLAKHTKWA